MLTVCHKGRWSFIIIIILSQFGVGACERTSPKKWVQGWQGTSPLLEARSGAGAVQFGRRLYIAGGASIEKGFLNSAESVTIRPDGQLESWHLVSPLTTRRGFLALVAANGYLYAIGGANGENGIHLLNTVEHAKINEEGGLGPWTPVSPMTTPRRGPAALVSQGYLYAIGGYNGIFLRNLERAPLLPNGDLGNWEVVNSLLTTDRYIHGAALSGNHLYVVGGHIQGMGGGKESTEWTRIGKDGQFEPWRPASPLLFARFLAAVAASDQYLFILGGYNGQYMASVERAAIQTDGSLGPWSATTPLSHPKEGCAAVSVDGRIYLMGGSNSGVYLRDVEMAWINQAGELGYWANSSPQTPPPQP
ncbi:MAG: hypothetical protein L0Y56_16765 [Nitrospira sp.]|nr:hypothetical protein [Nitrospira sp.]